MTYVLLHDNQVAGMADTVDGLPDGFTGIAYDTTNVNLDDLYWDGQAIQIRPGRPIESAHWDYENHAWVAPAIALPLPAFYGTELFQLARVAGRRRPTVATELAVALAAEYSRDYETLVDSITELRTLLKDELSTTGDTP